MELVILYFSFVVWYFRLALGGQQSDTIMQKGCSVNIGSRANVKSIPKRVANKHVLPRAGLVSRTVGSGRRDAMQRELLMQGRDFTAQSRMMYLVPLVVKMHYGLPSEWCGNSR